MTTIHFLTASSYSTKNLQTRDGKTVKSTLTIGLRLRVYSKLNTGTYTIVFSETKNFKLNSKNELIINLFDFFKVSKEKGLNKNINQTQ